MAFSHRIVQPSRIKGSVLSQSGERLTPPEDWDFLAAGDAAITRSVKSKGATWVVQVQRGRRSISKGIWAKKTDISSSRQQIEQQRSTPEYARRRHRDLARRKEKHEAYVDEFLKEVLTFLDFHPRYQVEAKLLASKVSDHATPVGSGTVARTERIPIEKRAEAAVIAWMRHQTTGYDSMSIARIKGRRREVRRLLARRSVELLERYRSGHDVATNCPLKKLLSPVKNPLLCCTQGINV